MGACKFLREQLQYYKDSNSPRTARRVVVPWDRLFLQQ